MVSRIVKMKWFSRWWWSYLFERPDHYARRYQSDWLAIDWLKRLWCRLRNHPAGVVWYNPGKFEPNMRCKDCGDDLG